MIKGGKLRALARDHRDSARRYFPDVPTLGDTVKGYEASAWFGMGVPARRRRTSSRCSTRRSNEGLADRSIKKRIADLGGMPMGGTPEDFGKIIASETEKWKKVVEFSGASVE